MDADGSMGVVKSGKFGMSKMGWSKGWSNCLMMRWCPCWCVLVCLVICVLATSLVVNYIDSDAYWLVTWVAMVDGEIGFGGYWPIRLWLIDMTRLMWMNAWLPGASMNVDTVGDMHAWMVWNAMGWVVVSLSVIDRDLCRCMVSYVNGVWIIRGAMQCLDGLNGYSRIGCENSHELKNAYPRDFVGGVLLVVESGLMLPWEMHRMDGLMMSVVVKMTRCIWSCVDRAWV